MTLVPQGAVVLLYFNNNGLQGRALASLLACKYGLILNYMWKACCRRCIAAAL